MRKKKKEGRKEERRKDGWKEGKDFVGIKHDRNSTISILTLSQDDLKIN